MRKHVVSVPLTDEGQTNSNSLHLEIDRGSTTAKQATDGRIWLVRLRREGTAVIVNSGLSLTSAEHLARQIKGILELSDAGLQGGAAMAKITVIVERPPVFAPSYSHRCPIQFPNSKTRANRESCPCCKLCI
jgi:hypothetical protein